MIYNALVDKVDFGLSNTNDIAISFNFRYYDNDQFKFISTNGIVLNDLEQIKGILLTIGKANFNDLVNSSVQIDIDDYGVAAISNILNSKMVISLRAPIENDEITEQSE